MLRTRVQWGPVSLLRLSTSGMGVATVGLVVRPRSDLISSLSSMISSLSSNFPPYAL